MRSLEVQPPAVMALVQLALVSAKGPWVSAPRLGELLDGALSRHRITAALIALETAGVVRRRRESNGQEEWSLV